MKLFVINLQEADVRRQRVEEKLLEIGVECEFFQAINGFSGLPSRLSMKPNDKYRIKYRGRPLTPGEKGVYASHYALWEKCVELGEPIVVLEDDFLPTPFFSSVIDKLPYLHETYDYLRLEPQDTNFDCKMIENTDDGFQVVMWMDNAGGARGYSITPKAARSFIEQSEQWLCAVDNFIGEPYKHGIPSMGLLPYAIYNPSDMESQIQNKVKLSKVPLKNKFFREIERFSRKSRLALWNITYQKPIK